MFLERFYRWTFSTSIEEKEEALMYIQNLIIFLNRLASLSMTDESSYIENGQNTMLGESSPTGANFLDDDYHIVNL